MSFHCCPIFAHINMYSRRGDLRYPFIDCFSVYSLHIGMLQ